MSYWHGLKASLRGHGNMATSVTLAKTGSLNDAMQFVTFSIQTRAYALLCVPNYLLLVLDCF